MKILVDENIPRMTVNRLRELDHDVRDIRGSTDQGLVDTALWDIAVREGRLLITTDKGFAEYRTMTHNGILIVRLRQPNLWSAKTRSVATQPPSRDHIRDASRPVRISSPPGIREATGVCAGWAGPAPTWAPADQGLTPHVASHGYNAWSTHE